MICATQAEALLGLMVVELQTAEELEQSVASQSQQLYEIKIALAEEKHQHELDDMKAKTAADEAARVTENLQPHCAVRSQAARVELRQEKALEGALICSFRAELTLAERDEGRLAARLATALHEASDALAECVRLRAAEAEVKDEVQRLTQQLHQGEEMLKQTQTAHDEATKQAKQAQAQLKGELAAAQTELQ
eukprot:6205584-Pleurochrysis_carterae.AAC.1